MFWEDKINEQKSADYRFFKIDYNSFDRSQFNIQYYDPELSSLDDKSRNKVLLSDIADVILPRSVKQKSHTLSHQYFTYPLSSKIPVSDNGTNVVLQKGDILVASIGFKKAYLVDDKPPIEICPPPTFLVIRPRSDVVTPYYLFLYLQSDTAIKYAQRFATGTIVTESIYLLCKTSQSYFQIKSHRNIQKPYSKNCF